MDKFEYIPPKNLPVSTQNLIEDLKSVSKKLNTDSLSQEQYHKAGKYSTTIYKNRFGTWNNALQKAGLKITKIAFRPTEELFENILNIWQKLGRQPRQGDIDSNLSKISSGIYKKRFGNWTAAIKEFIEFANNKDLPIDSHTSYVLPKKNRRDPSLRLRYQILKRDNFSCVKCGASPAKNPEIILHIDHIIAGGEADISNLQTLCEKCNLGKSNL